MKELLSEVQVGLQVKDAETPGTSYSMMPLPPWTWKSKGRKCVTRAWWDKGGCGYHHELESWRDRDLAGNTMRKAGYREKKCPPISLSLSSHRLISFQDLPVTETNWKPHSWELRWCILQRSVSGVMKQGREGCLTDYHHTPPMEYIRSSSLQRELTAIW